MKYVKEDTFNTMYHCMVIRCTESGGYTPYKTKKARMKFFDKYFFKLRHNVVRILAANCMMTTHPN